MKNKIFLKGVVLGLITSFHIACSPKKEEAITPKVDKEQIKAQIVAIETVMADIYNMRSAASEEYYAEDAISFSQNEAPLKGKFAIDQSIKENLATLVEGDKVSFSVNEIFPSNDGMQVVEIGSYKVVDSTNTLLFSGNYMSFFEKRGDKYVCIRDMTASDMQKTEKK